MPFRAALAAIVLGALPGCSEEPGATRPNIVVIVLDTARPDFLSAYGYPRPTSPFLESFAGSGTRFDRAYSSSSWTLPAHGSLFTGRSPEEHEANQTTRRVSDALPLLPERLREAGYQTAGFSGNMWVSELGGLDRGFDHFENLNKGIYRPHVRKLAGDREGERIVPEEHYVLSRVHEWLEGARAPDRPFFLFVNLVEPHIPYLPDWEAGRHFLSSRDERFDAIGRFFPDGVTRGYVVRNYRGDDPYSEDDWRRVTHMYEGALRVVDDLARGVVEAVDEVSDPGNTVVFIVSDHGENLGDHGHVTHIFNLYDSNLRIVCLARGPGFAAGSVEERLVHIGDVYATALGAAAVEPDRDSGGVDLRREIPDDRVLAATLEYPSVSLGLFPKRVAQSGVLDAYKVELRAAVGPRYKLILATDRAGNPVREELYDLIADPEETRPLDPESVDADAVEALRASIRESMLESFGKEGVPLEELDEETLESLRALGYVP